MANTAQEALDKKKQEAQEQAAAEAKRKQEEEAAYREKENAERLEKSRLEQEEQDKKDELAARLAAAHELLAEHGMTPATTPNAGASPVPAASIGQGLPAVAASTVVGLRTFQHLYAGAGVVMEKGKRLVFGGPNGGIGYYSTNKPSEIELLNEIANTPGSMVTEVKQAPDGRYVTATDPILQAEQLAVQRDSRRNTENDLNPNVQNARQNLSRTIAQNS